MAVSYSPALIAPRLLSWSARTWFVSALAGQWLFAAYILWVLVRPLLAGEGEAVNRITFITGYVAGDTIGNASLVSHLLAAGALNLVGLLQLLPWLRRRYPAWHRWAGRSFMVMALAATLTGFWLSWGRGARLGELSAIATSLNGVLIVVAVVMAWRLARQRRFAEHRRWAIRAFLLVSGVWMLRLGLMAWLIVNQGPRGNTSRLDGPFDTFWVFGCFLLPLAVAELYFRAEHADPATQNAAALILSAGALLTALGTFGAFTGMWGPHF